VERVRTTVLESPWPTPDVYTAWRYYRQTRSDFISGVFTSMAPCDSEVPAVSTGSELINLKYPLHVGARWPWDEWGLIGQEVESVEVVELPFGRFPAFKVRVFGIPDHEITWWYGRYGLLKRTDRYTQTCIDPVCGCDTRVEWTQILVDVHLEGAPPAP